METVKCTPRPWRAELGEVHEVRDSEGGRICILTQLRGKNGLCGRRSDHESTTNAHLIAAAPEIYAALELVLPFLLEEQQVLERSYLPEPDEEESAGLERIALLIKVVSEAIAKAKGKAGA